MSVDFSQLSNFNKDANYSSVRIGSGARILEVEMNEMQDIQNEARADIIRDSIPSGFIRISDIDYSYTAINPNTIRLQTDSIAYVNGYRITIPAGTVITLDAPPTSGSRDDLVFLEVWKEEKKGVDIINRYGGDNQGTVSNTIQDSRTTQETARRIQLRWRLRVVDGVDFGTYPEGMCNLTSDIGSNTSNWSIATPQGGNLAPIQIDTSVNKYKYQFNSFAKRQNSYYTNAIALTDSGLYTAGDGSSTLQLALRTLDGYVYAIPMFKVHRRNSAQYSVDNANGGKMFIPLGSVTSSVTMANQGDTITVSMASTTGIYEGDYLGAVNGLYRIPYMVVTSVVDSTHVSGIVLRVFSAGSYGWVDFGTRPDLLHSNIISDRDIMDLRHKVSLTGIDPKQLLDENFYRLMRKELQTLLKTTMVKTYHGIPKTPIDDNTVFYASFDGTTKAEVGGDITVVNSIQFRPTFSGLGVYFPHTTMTGYNYLKPVAINGVSVNQGTIDVTIDSRDMQVNSNGSNGILVLVDSQGYSCLKLAHVGLKIEADFCSTQGVVDSEYLQDTIPKYGIHHIRVTWNSTTNVCSLYIDGVLKKSITYTTLMMRPAYLALGESLFTSQMNLTTGVGQYCANGLSISDVMISNIDRGATFATLPQDFIDGYARIMPSFSEQKSVQSDVIFPEHRIESIKALGENKRQFTITQGTPGEWSSGDTIKIKGLTGEIVSGVIDSDTATTIMSRDIPNTSPNTDVSICVRDTSKFIAGDTFKLMSNPNLVLSVTSITDVNNMVVKCTNGYTWGATSGDVLIEVTAATSSPLVKANIMGLARGGASNTITLPSTFSSVDDFYNGMRIDIIGGTGAGQSAYISDYVGSTRVATMNIPWVTIPDTSSMIEVYGIGVSGTWTNVGTNEATLTLGSTPGLMTDDIIVEYGLIDPAGQGGMPEAMSNILSGETTRRVYNYTINSNFNNKIPADTRDCPSYATKASDSILRTPPSMQPDGETSSEFTQVDYTNISSIDSNCMTYSVSSMYSHAEVMFAFNIIDIIERKLGTIPGESTSDKVVWLWNNVYNITGQCNMYGSSPSGNKSSLAIWASNNSTWATPATDTSSSSVPVTRSTNAISAVVGLDGFVYFLAYADPANGTVPSVINVDYASISITLKPSARFGLSFTAYPAVTEATDYANKVASSLVENANIFYTDWQSPATSLLVPTDAGWIQETVQSEYNSIASADGMTKDTAASNNGGIAQQLFAFDLIALVERKYGPIPGCSTTADKVTWLKNNISSVVCDWTGYGCGPSGAKAHLDVYTQSGWGGAVTNSATSAALSQYGVAGVAGISSTINSNGFIYFMAYSDPSDGVTQAHIYTDYIDLVVTFYPQAKLRPALQSNTTLSKSNLMANPVTHIVDDLAEKVYGDTQINPHSAFVGYGAALNSPYISWEYPFDQASYDAIAVRGGVSRNVSTVTVGQIPQMLFAFDMVRAVEDKFGKIPSNDKIAWLKANIKSVVCNLYGYASAETSDNLYLTAYSYSGSRYYGDVAANGHGSATQLIYTSNSPDLANYIHPNGFMYFLAYTDAVGTAKGSNMYIDYVNLNIKLNVPSGYDVLSPENPRRDDGQSALLLVRKDNKEIQSLFNFDNEPWFDRGLVTYGDYVPKQGSIPPDSLMNGFILCQPKMFATSFTTRAVMNIPSGQNVDLLDEYLKIDSSVSSAVADGSSLKSVPSGMNLTTSLIDMGVLTPGFLRYISSGKITSIGSTFLAIDGYGIYPIVDSTQIPSTCKYVVGAAYLAKDVSGVLYMLVAVSSYTSFVNLNPMGSSAKMLAFKIDKNILIK